MDLAFWEGLVNWSEAVDPQRPLVARARMAYCRALILSLKS